MKLGIDFGTTRIVAAAVDRGNYPVVNFENSDGDAVDWFPPLVALRGEERAYGWDAWAVQGDGSWTVVRSLKRLLEDAGPHTQIEVDGGAVPILELLGGLTKALEGALRKGLRSKEGFEAMLGVPANANSNQRFLTAEAFRRAGFTVLGILNEPSAASIEYGHREKGMAEGKRRLMVYDLGGGTFDVSLVEHDERTHEVLASEGIGTLGGDDFDHVLAEMALEAAGLSLDGLTQAEVFRLLEECRTKKESLHPNTRKLVIELGGVREGMGEVLIGVPDYYERLRPMVEETVHVVRDLLEGYAEQGLDTLYVTGGGSELPLIARVLKEDFGRRVKRSAYTRSATAIGLAIQADASAGYELRDRFTRYFGVWREAEGGSQVVFDPLFEKGMALPGSEDAAGEIRRVYMPVHNIGHLRYLECSSLAADGRPAGDLTIWDEIRFPFDPELADREDLSGTEVALSMTAAGQRIEERYGITPEGQVRVTVRNLTSGYERSWALGRWGKRETVKPSRKRRGSKTQFA